MPEALIIAVVLGALLFDFINGFHDTANAIATTVLTRALRIPHAIIMAAVLNFAGALWNEQVAATVGKDIVDPSAMTLQIVVAALMGAIIWNIITWRLGLPSSSSHALIGGLVGAVSIANTRVYIADGAAHWQWAFGMFQLDGLRKVILALILSPIVGIVAGFLFTALLLRIFGKWPAGRINRGFRFAQIFSAAAMAFSHGGNDAQKSMGIITMALVAGRFLPDFHVPLWVKIACAASMALGTALGGWRIIKTIGRNLMELKPLHGFAAETAGALVIQFCTRVGAPVSTTHVISSSIMGVGISRRIRDVKWKVAGNIILAWCLTLPLAALMAAIPYMIISRF
jgi:PiT family inorganic phosphate transporter